VFRRFIVVVLILVLVQSGALAEGLREQQRMYPEQGLQAELWAEAVDLFWSYKDPRRNPATWGMHFQCSHTCYYYIDLYGQKAFESYLEDCVRGVGQLAIKYDKWYNELSSEQAITKTRRFFGRAENYALWQLARWLSRSDLYEREKEEFPDEDGAEWSEVRPVWEIRIEAERLKRLEQDRNRVPEE